MVRYAPLFPAIGLTLACSCGTPDGLEITRSISGSVLTPSASQIQETHEGYRIRQSFTIGGQRVTAVTLWIARYPKYEERQVMIRLLDRHRELRRALCDIPLGESLPVRAAFNPIMGMDTLFIEAYVPQGRPGHSAGIEFFPVDQYPNGELWVGGRKVPGDLLFRVHTSDATRLTLSEGLDLFTVPQRFPSEQIKRSHEVVQGFVSPADSLSGLDILVGMGGEDYGPLVNWELVRHDRTLRRGMKRIIGDNHPQRISFPLLVESAGIPFSLKLQLAEAWEDEFRFWICERGEGFGSLVIGDRMVEGSLVLQTQHVCVSPDSMRVILAADGRPITMQGPPVAGDCSLTQTFRWPREPAYGDRVGMRLALGGGLVAGAVDYQIRESASGAVVHQGAVSLGGRDKNEFLWFPLGWPRAEAVLSIDISAPRTRAETAARFWWIPVDVHPHGDAVGCVPEPGGDMVFRLATTHPIGSWISSLAAYSAEAAGFDGHGLKLLLWVRLALIGVAFVGVVGWALAFLIHRT